MKDIYAVAIVGGGFSGVVSAISLGGYFGGKNIALIERKDRIGKKILATGNGRGNLSNTDLTERHYHSSSGANVKDIIEKYGSGSLVDFFSSLGVDHSVEDGRIYPASMQASSVLDMMRLKLSELKVKESVGVDCKDISFKDGVFKLSCEGETFFAEKVVLCCGGKAGSQYGTDGTSYRLAQNFGHTLTALRPAIVQIRTDNRLIRGLKGLKQNACVKVVKNGEEAARFTGDLLFTDYGVSGNSAFYLSSYIDQDRGRYLSIDFAPEKSRERLTEFLTRKAALGYIGKDDALTGVLNKQIGRAVVKYAGISKFDKFSVPEIVSAIKDFRLEVTGTQGFDSAQVTKGGIRADEVDSKTFESKKRKGLYIVGEMLDVDGDCGGYNLQWAYSSAMSACEEIKRNDKNR
ncbi:MAG: aminoacetone oxidase family FAD-binding enzyme [Clostridia bacterium]|nr:aminoacetone oxidase family FAD-binding enzyme [Clostridia bacterium]